MSIEELHDEVDEYQEDVEQVEDDEVVDDEQDVDDADDDDQDETQADEDDGLGFSFDETDEDADPFAGQEAPEWVKKVREENRDLKRERREWQQQQGQSQQQALRDRPSWDDYEFDENSPEYLADLDAWYAEKAQHDTQVQEQAAKYQKYDDNYAASADAMTAKVPNYKELEQNIVDVLSSEKQAMIKIACGDAARMVVALGKSPQQLAKLEAMNEVEFVYALGKMETSMSNPQKSNKPKPTSHKLQGSAGGGDAQLEKLEAAADKSGDRSAVIAYRRKMRNK